jgi:uncharacterized protein (DUF342 family)
LGEAEAAALLARLKTLPKARLVPDGAEIFPIDEATGIARAEKGAVIGRIVQPEDPPRALPEDGAANANAAGNAASTAGAAPDGVAPNGESAAKGAADGENAPGTAAADKAAVRESAGEAGKDVFGNVLPALPGNDPELKIFRGLGQHGSVIDASESGLLLVKIQANSFWAQILECRDAKIVVHISGDAMEASADLYAESGAGEPLSAALAAKALADAGVTRGIDKAALENACKLARIRGAGGCAGQILARGEAPVAKGAPAVKWLLASVKPAAGAWEKPLAVKAGEPLAEISPALAEGRGGFDVRGNALDADAAIPAELSHDDSVSETPRDGGIVLTAARDGIALYNGKELAVSGVQGIEGDVGKATGNVNFSGELHITGKVEAGYSVMGGRNVSIDGCAEAALVSSGGGVLVAGGIRGAGKGVVRARTTIETAFVSESTLLAVDDITVKAGCVRCNIKTNGRLFISGETGKIAGGVCKARQGLEAFSIGSDKGGRTEISFGQDYLIKDQIEVSEREISKIKAALAAIEEKIKQAADKPAVLNASRAEKVKMMKLLEQLNLKVFTLREKFEEHHESEVRVRGTIYPGVVLESHGRYFEVSRERSAVVFYFDRETGQIRERPLS